MEYQRILLGADVPAQRSSLGLMKHSNDLASFKHEPLDLGKNQIGIDQSNIHEQNHQVRLMKALCKTATVVFAYTDPDTPSAQLALKAMFPTRGGVMVPGEETKVIVEEFCRREY